MLYKVVLLALVAVAAAENTPPPQSYSPPEPTYGAPQPTYGQPEPESPPKYDFQWSVKDDYSSNDFGHNEKRDGYNTDGQYYVLLPDGRTQRVTYNVNGDSGFVAQVEYEGEAQPPQETYGPPAPSYQPPVAPTYQPPSPPSYQPPSPQSY